MTDLFLNLNEWPWSFYAGDGIADGDCDCDGNQSDALGVCGGSCVLMQTVMEFVMMMKI